MPRQRSMKRHPPAYGTGVKLPAWACKPVRLIDFCQSHPLGPARLKNFQSATELVRGRSGPLAVYPQSAGISAWAARPLSYDERTDDSQPHDWMLTMPLITTSAILLKVMWVRPGKAPPRQLRGVGAGVPGGRLLFRCLSRCSRTRFGPARAKA